mgnify:CR=1 FL=1
MKWRMRYLKMFVSALLLVTLSFVLWTSNQKKILRIGVYAGSSWDVPNSRENRVLDNIIRQFEKSHPNVKVVYESGIPKKDYDNWLAEKILKGEQADVFMVPENDFSMLAASGAFKSLDSLISKEEAAAYYPVLSSWAISGTQLCFTD